MMMKFRPYFNTFKICKRFSSDNYFNAINNEKVNPFTSDIKSKISKHVNTRRYINFNMQDKFNLDVFTSKVNNLHGISIVIIKLAFTNNEFKIAGGG